MKNQLQYIQTSVCFCLVRTEKQRLYPGLGEQIKTFLLFPSCLEYIYLNIECHCDLSSGVGRCLRSPSAIHLDMLTMFPVR